MTMLDLQAAIQQLQHELTGTQMQLVRTMQLATAAQADLALLRAGRTPRFAVEFASQFGEDLLAWKLLGGQLDGFFIEAGAFDGYRYSVTYALEAVGWNGLLVEPLPEAAEQCRQRRRASRVVQAGLSKPGSPQSSTFHVLEDQYGGMLSYLRPTQDHVAGTNWAKRSTITVPVTTLDALLVDHGGPIDLLALDVEGNELDVLEGFDIERFKPRLMIIEDNSQGRDPALANYMSHFPYEFSYRVAVNAVYVRKDQAEILDRVKWLKLG